MDPRKSYGVPRDEDGVRLHSKAGNENRDENILF
jgi:hypothetical protein